MRTFRPRFRFTRITAALAIALIGSLIGSGPRVAGAAIDESRFADDLRAITQPPTRVVGSDGYYQTARWLESQISQLPNVELRRQEFPIVVPVTRSATLTLSDGRVEPVYPFWPAAARVCSTPPGGIRARLVYCGDAKIDQIRPADIAGQIAVIEASAGQLWPRAAYMGARAIVVLGSADMTHWDLRYHDLQIPINLPRFYVPPGALAEQLRSNATSGEAILKAQVVWEKRTGVNLLALVRPKQAPAADGLMPAPRGWFDRDDGTDPGKIHPPGALMFSAPFDSSGLVPDVARGASQAVQTAANLALLRDAARSPLDRPLVFFFGGGDGIQFLASRQMLMALAEAPATWRDELNDLSAKQADAQRDFDRARELSSHPRDLNIRRDRALIDRIVQIIETDLTLEQDRIFRLRLTPADQRTGAMIDEEKRLADRQVMLNRLKAAFQIKPADLASPELSSAAASVMQRVLVRLNGEDDNASAKGTGLLKQYAARQKLLDERIELYEWLAAATGRDPNPAANDTRQRLIELVVGLDLSDRGGRVGPMFYGLFQRVSAITDVQDYGNWFTRIARTAAAKPPPGQAVDRSADWFNDLRGVVDLEPLIQARAPQSYLCAPMPIPTELTTAWGVPGFSMVTLDDQRLARDTPADTPDRIDTAAILPQLHAVRELFWHAANDARFRGPGERRRQRTSIVGQVVSTAPGKPVPNLPRDGFFATYSYVSTAASTFPKLRNTTSASAAPGTMPWTLGIRRTEMIACDDEGNYRIEGLPRLHGDLQHFAVTMWRTDPISGAITGCTDLGKQAGDIKIYCDIKIEQNPIRSLVFDCEEFPLVGLYDPRFLQSLNEVLPMDARRNAEPQRFCMFLHERMFAGFLEPGTRAYLAFRYGRVGNRLLLLNIPRGVNNSAGRSSDARPSEARPSDARPSDVRPSDMHPDGARGEGKGFSIPELNSIPPLSLVTSRDFWRLDEIRLNEYRRAGVSGNLIDELHSRAAGQIDAAEQSIRSNDALGFVKHADGAWANEARVYDAARDMARDVIRAAIFLLLLCVPFAFCIERLIVGTPNVYRQIAGIFAIFAIMTAALWSFHPAFKISSSPLIIILAFAIIFMSIVVIAVVYGKFDSELKKIRSGRGTAEGASLARASVLMSAVLLGIANMRKRKFRTALTSITIVLITFAVLCFTSSSKYLDTTTLPTGVATSGNHGVMLRQRGFRQLPSAVAESMAAVIGRDYRIVEKWWNIQASDPKDQIALVARARAERIVVPMQAMLGLSPGESALTRVAEVIGPGKFARLENGETNIIYLAAPVAKQLGVNEGDVVRMAGFDLAVAGIYDPAEFDNKVVMLSGEPIAPLKYSKDALDAGGRRLDDSAVESLDLDADTSASEASASYEHLSSSQFAIVPAAISQKLPNASLRVIAIKAANEQQVKEISDELTKRYAIATFAGYDDGVRMVAAGNLSSVSGAGEVAIPLAIAGLIIFNTMMGSIAERRREIHVYTSLGLAPLHVGALFVAEAMTYGLIGTVFGYIIGQGIGTALLKLGWLGNVTLNYSGTSAMLTMGLILLIVLLSALVPARLASKIAAPSIERSWRVPYPKGDEIVATLPFTINKTAADGALAYLAEFFDAHKEGSIGKFSAGKVETFSIDEKIGDTDQITSRGLKTIIWLTPFDLGVRQHLMLLIHPSSASSEQGVRFPDIYEVQVILQRLSGDDGSWWRMNRTFLTELRKQFLQWRSLSPQRMLEYVSESKRLFQATPEQVVTTETVGEVARLA